MTKTVGALAPQSVAACENCMHIRRQAEEAFTELRAQTDRHILAVQKKLKDDHSCELSKVNSANDILTADIARLKELLSKLEKDKRSQAQSEKELEARIADIRGECETKINEIERSMRKEELAASKEREDLLRSHRKDVQGIEEKIQESNARLLQSNKKIEELEQENVALRSQISKSKLELQLELDRQTRLIYSERDNLKDQLALSQQRLGTIENWKTEGDLERAKLDLAYRKRIGEMESEVRRTEIESVRLRREIIQLSQKLELAEPRGATSNNFLMLRSGRQTKQLSLEGFRPVSSGRITRVVGTADRTGDVEELPPLTPSSN